jgi:hypothetical protein
MVSEKTDRSSGDARTLLVGITGVPWRVDEALPELLVAEATDSEARVGNRCQQLTVFASRLKRSDATTTFALACCDLLEDRAEWRRGAG